MKNHNNEKKYIFATSTIINIQCRIDKDTRKRMQQQPQHMQVHDWESRTMHNAEDNKNKTMYSRPIQYQPARNQDQNQHFEISNPKILNLPILVRN